MRPFPLWDSALSSLPWCSPQDQESGGLTESDTLDLHVEPWPCFAPGLLVYEREVQARGVRMHDIAGGKELIQHPEPSPRGGDWKIRSMVKAQRIAGSPYLSCQEPLYCPSPKGHSPVISRVPICKGDTPNQNSGSPDRERGRIINVQRISQ